MKIIKILFLVVFLSMMPQVLMAECYYAGQSYPTGTNIGGLVCQPDGTWR